jgi:hypothetical protein
LPSQTSRPLLSNNLPKWWPRRHQVQNANSATSSYGKPEQLDFNSSHDASERLPSRPIGSVVFFHLSQSFPDLPMCISSSCSQLITQTDPNSSSESSAVSVAYATSDGSNCMWYLSNSLTSRNLALLCQSKSAPIITPGVSVQNPSTHSMVGARRSHSSPFVQLLAAGSPFGISGHSLIRPPVAPSALLCLGCPIRTVLSPMRFRHRIPQHPSVSLSLHSIIANHLRSSYEPDRLNFKHYIIAK